jgi:hypothetical protein
VAQLLSFLSGLDTQLINGVPALSHRAGCTVVVHLLVKAYLPQAAAVAHSTANSSGRQQQRSKARQLAAICKQQGACAIVETASCNQARTSDTTLQAVTSFPPPGAATAVTAAQIASYNGC